MMEELFLGKVDRARLKRTHADADIQQGQRKKSRNEEVYFQNQQRRISFETLNQRKNNLSRHSNKKTSKNRKINSYSNINEPCTSNTFTKRRHGKIKRPKKLSLFGLQDLITKSSGEILLTILNNESGFMILLDEEIKHDSMAYVLLALGKAIDSHMNNNINSMILNITSNKKFWFESLPKYLATFHLSKSEECHLNSLLCLTDFLQKFQASLPSNAAENLPVIMPLLEVTCEKNLKDHDKLYPVVFKKLQELKEQNKLVLDKYGVKEIKQVSHSEKLHLMKPPENYRSIPVFPNATDIHQACAFLRPNITKGKYQDTEHYLDVQYRLLREDYVRPLREGISEYLKLKNRGKPTKHCKDVRVYTDVQIVKQEFVNGGLVHMASFKDRKFSRIKWEYSKRFLTGSLLCLSSDDFKTMLFASVARRDCEELLKGFLFLRFEEITDEVLNLNPSRYFVVIETSAYFEAYRYNLNALIELNDANLPMKQYIVETQEIVQKPAYLNELTTYDMGPLLLPLDYSKEYRSNEYYSNIDSKTKNINILNENSWPTSSELNLDPSQYAALQAAITKEFAVIQGPPGTGKTFVGLRIAQLLLHNIKKIQLDADQLPILVICYTNHALDQFLEGLLLFTDKLVRVGGRVNNEAIAKFQLSTLKNAIKRVREVPDYIFYTMKQKSFRLKSLKEEVSKIQKSIAKGLHTILSETELFNHMPLEHFYSLQYAQRFSDQLGYMIHIWLGLYSMDDIPGNKKINSDPKAGFSKFGRIKKERDDFITNEGYLDETEADIEYIEAERALFPEEFADLSYDLPELNEEINEWHRKKNVDSERLKQNYIIHNLENNLAMPEYYAKNIDDVWDVAFKDRWSLYKYWVELFTENKEKECSKLQEELRKEYKELGEMRNEEDIYVCKQAHVVGMTTTGAAKYRHIVQRLNPKILIVEEAAEILESHIVTSLAPGTQHVILIGDHQQLQPSPTVHLLAVKYNLHVSLFERMVGNGLDCQKLNIQHRMRPEIASLISPHIYDNLQNHESVTKYENIKGVNQNVFFISHTFNELQEKDSKSKVNKHEAMFIVKLCRYFILQGYSSSQITVLTTYSGQLFEMKRLCAQSILKGVKFTVVDNYQGEENDIVLISFVRSNDDQEIGFLKVSNRICVALSRAKMGLFCIGNFKLLAEKSDLWKNIVNQLEKDNAIGNSLSLVCQNHPELIANVETEKDFDSVPEGGCTQKCVFRLSCGHVCPLICHHYDEEHKEINCMKPCDRSCSEGHLCKKKCYEPCGDCIVTISKKLESCGHTIQIPCYQIHEDCQILCTELCTKYLPCGHMCTSLCCEPCVTKCVEIVKVSSKVCGHKVIMKCFNYDDEELLTQMCQNPCKAELSCGHICKGTCNKCHQGRVHVACKQPCKRILVCGHECQSPCSKSCPPCKQPCENRCFHSKCPKKCGKPCDKCTEPCRWSCKHKKCNHRCGDPCNRTACDKPCRKRLKCKHPCIGLCGEPCPVECRICNEEKVKEIFFGSEDEPDTRFIALEDCNHIFELDGITKWMNQDIHEKREVQMKACPKCKVVIRKNLRFGNIIKSCLADVEKVKKEIYGDTKQNIKSQETLLQRLKEDSGTYNSITKRLIKELDLAKIRSIQTITTLENIYNVLLELEETREVLNEFIPVSSDTSIQTDGAKLRYYIKTTYRWLKDLLRKKFLTLSEQQLQEITWEIHRLKLASKFLALLQTQANVKPNLHFNNLLGSIITYVPFHEEEAKQFTLELEKFIEVIGGAKLNVSELEKKSILKAMGLSKGHWYQCPNGHVYCITECGGAMQVGKCNECGESIGGSRHALLSSNQVATAMDGAEHPAWSDAMNMGNYQF